jgi:hypothetical protein
MNCGYIMRTGEELMSTGLLSLFNPVKGFISGLANSSFGNSKGVKCPKCGKLGRWTDCD